MGLCLFKFVLLRSKRSYCLSLHYFVPSPTRFFFNTCCNCSIRTFISSFDSINYEYIQESDKSPYHHTYSVYHGKIGGNGCLVSGILLQVLTSFNKFFIHFHVKTLIGRINISNGMQNNRKKSIF